MSAASSSPSFHVTSLFFSSFFYSVLQFLSDSGGNFQFLQDFCSELGNPRDAELHFHTKVNLRLQISLESNLTVCGIYSDLNCFSTLSYLVNHGSAYHALTKSHRSLLWFTISCRTGLILRAILGHRKLHS